MQILPAIAFVLLAIGLVKAFGIGTNDLEALADAVLRPRNLKALARPKKRRVLTALQRTRNMMRATGRSGSFYSVLAGSALLLFLGAAAGIGTGNAFLIPVLALGAAAIPFVYIRFQYIQYHRMTLSELETALSIITLSYERTENILAAIQENLDTIRPPVRQAFEEFVFEVESINPNVETAIGHMKKKIDNSVFLEWCDMLGRCSRDRTLKHTLRPVVEKLSQMNVVDAMKLIRQEHPEIEVNILSAVLSDSKFALSEKNAWLDKYLPEIDQGHRIFPPCGTEKGGFVPGGVKTSDSLLDDYTKNLAQWDGSGVKLLNGINHTHKTWQGPCVDASAPPLEIAQELLEHLREASPSPMLQESIHLEEYPLNPMEDVLLQDFTKSAILLKELEKSDPVQPELYRALLRERFGTDRVDEFLQSLKNGIYSGQGLPDNSITDKLDEIGTSIFPFRGEQGHTAHPEPGDMEL